MPTGFDRSVPQPRLLRVREAALLLNSSERTVWRLLAKRRLATVKLGRAVRIPLAELERFIAAGGAR